MTDLSIHSGSNFRTTLNDILGRAAASVLTATFGLSYSLLIFAGPLSPYLSYGIATTFISSAILGAVIEELKREKPMLGRKLLTYFVAVMAERLAFANRMIGVLRR